MALIQQSSLVLKLAASPTGKPAGPQLVLLQQAPPTGKLSPGSQAATPTGNPHKVGLIRRRTVSIQIGQS